MDIGSVLSRAWQIIWKHKVLWIFGILSGCASGGGGSGYSGSGGGGGNGPGGSGFNPADPVQRFFSDMPDWQIAAIIIGVILVVLLIIVIAVFLGTIGRIGLVRGTQQVEKGAESLTFGELFSGSMPYFWRVFLLNLAVGLGFGLIAAAFVVMLALGSVATLGLGLICMIPLVCLLVPVAWVVQVLVQQSSIAIVIENLGIMDGLRRGWAIMKNNPGTYILMWLILVLGIGLIGGLVIGLPMILVAAPAIAGVAFGTQEALTNGLIFAGICLVCYLPIAIVLNGILASFTGSAWTLAFMRLTETHPEIPEPSTTF